MAAKDLEVSNGLPPADRLDSWKEIAVYLGRDVRTVQRWEKTEALPVHRHVHEKLGTVYAYKSEIEAWRSSRRLAEMPEAEPGDEPAEQPAETEEVGVENAGNQARRFQRVRPSVFWGSAAAVLLLVFFLGVLAWQRWDRWKHRDPNLTIVVLPFENLSGDPSQEYFSDGMTEELIVQLSRLHAGGVHAIAVGSSMGFKNTQKPIAQIAAELKAGYVVQGSVRRSGNQVRISAHLIQAKDDVHLWDESYDRDLRDILNLQTEVAAAIAGSIGSNLVAHASTPSRPVNPEAYEAYLKGRFFWNKRTPDDLYRAISQFQRATTVDSTYAPAYVGLADCYALLGSAEMGSLPPRQAMPLAKHAVTQALELDKDLAEAHASLAHIKLIYDWDWAGAEKEFQRAIQLNPAYATGHQWYALYLNAVGRPTDALAQLQKAQQLDPLSPAVSSAMAEAYYFARQYDQSIAESRKALEIDPNFVLGYLNLGRALEQQKKFDEAIAAFDKGRTLSGKGPAMSMFLAHAYAMKGDRKQPGQILAYLLQLPHQGPGAVYVPALYVAAVYTAMGDKDKAIQFLQQALQERCEYLIYLDREPMADSIRSDPRFEKLLQATGLHPPHLAQPRYTQ